MKLVRVKFRVTEEMVVIYYCFYLIYLDFYSLFLSSFAVVIIEILIEI